MSDHDDLTKMRIRDALVEPQFDEARERRILSNVREARPECSARRRWARWGVSAFAGALAILVVAALWPWGSTGTGSTADTVLSRAFAALQSDRTVIHLVARTTVRSYEPDRDSLGREAVTELESWSAVEGSLARRSKSQRVGSRVVFRQEELVRAGVMTALQSSQTPTGTEWSNVLEYDAAPFEQEGRGDPFTNRSGADLDVYKQLLASQEATLVGSGDVSGTPTYRLRFETPGFDQGTQTLLVDVRQADYLPVRVQGTEWYVWKGKKQIWREWITRYETFEVVARDRVPDAVFELAIPPGLQRRSDYSLTVAQASATYEGVRAYWLGGAYGGSSLAGGALRFERSEPSGYPRFLGMPGSIRDIVASMRPVLRGRSIVAQYGAEDEWEIQVVTFPRVPEKDWRFPSKARIEKVSVDGEQATLAAHLVGLHREGTSVEGDVLWLVRDMPDATVMLVGWDVTPDELVAAAEQVRHAENP